MPSLSRFFLKHSNCPSASMCLILNPLALYASIICFSDVIIVHFFSFLIISAVPKCMLHDIVIINGITLLMYMMSMARVTYLCCHSSSSGTSSNAIIFTLEGVFLVVLPFSDPKLGPSISSARNMSDLFIGQFGSMLFSTY